MKKLWCLLMAAMMLVTMIACTGPEASTPNDPATAPQTADQPEQTEAQTQPEQPTSGSDKDTLRVAVSKNIVALDAYTGNLLSFNLSYLIFDTLTKQNNEDLSVEPCLATSWEQVDDYTWRFNLREGVKFTNGEDFTAESAAYSINHLASLDKGYQNYRQWGLGWAPSAEVESDTSILITTPAPLMTLPNLLMRVVMLPMEASQQEGFAQSPVGSGPYKLSSWEPGINVTMESNSEYWDGEPAIRVLNMDIVTDESARTLAIQSGDYDLVYNVPFDTATNMLAENKTGMELIMEDSLAVNVIFYNGFSTNKFIQMKEFRKALTYAIDPYEICEYIMGGLVEPLNNVHAAGVLGGFETEGYPKRDVEKAKQLIEECGYDGSEISIILTSEEFANNADVIELIVAQMQDIGVNMVINEVDAATYKTMKATDQYDLSSNNYAGFTGDSEHYYLQGIKNINWTFEDAENILAQIYAEGITPEKRYELLTDLMEVCWDQCPYLFCVSNVNLFAASSDLKGIEIVPQTGFPLLSLAYFE